MTQYNPNLFLDQQVKERFSTILSYKLKLFIVEKQDVIFFSLRRYDDEALLKNLDAVTKNRIDLTMDQWKRLTLNAGKIKSLVQNNSKGFLHIGSDVYITVDETFISVRKYFLKQGQLRPTKRGISLNYEQWENLTDLLQAIYNIHITELMSHKTCDYYHNSQISARDCIDCNPRGWESEFSDAAPLGFENNN